MQEAKQDDRNGPFWPDNLGTDGLTQFVVWIVNLVDERESFPQSSRCDSPLSMRELGSLGAQAHRRPEEPRETDGATPALI